MTLAEIFKAKERSESFLLEIEGVVGVGVGEADVVLRVYVERTRKELREQILRIVQSVPVEIVEVGTPTLF